MYVGLAEMVQKLQQITWQVYSLDPEQVLQGLKKAVIRIPVQGYGPKEYVGIPKEKPPEQAIHRAWEKDEDEEMNNPYNNKELLSLARALVKLARVSDIQLKMNRQKYLLAKIKKNGETKQISLGPIAEILEQLGIEWRKKSITSEIIYK